MLTVNVSAPSVVASALGLTLNDPVLLVIVNEPDVVAKSPALVAIVQYSVVLLATLVVLTLNVPEAPSLILVGIVPKAYVAAGVREVSLIVTEALVATTVPLVEPVLMLTVNVSAPSVVVSAVGVTENDPVLLVIVNEPLDVAKSPALVATVQYNVVLLATLVVVTLNVPALPSLILVGIVPKAYVAANTP
jgi:hypothetical protein